MSLPDVEYIRHILQECVYLETITPRIKEMDELILNEDLKRAVIRSIEIIGEASRKIPTELKSKYPMIKWKQIAGMRDRLIHDYFGINYRIVWDVLNKKIPELKLQMEVVLTDLKG